MAPSPVVPPVLITAPIHVASMAINGGACGTTFVGDLLSEMKSLLLIWGFQLAPISLSQRGKWLITPPKMGAR